MYRSLGYVLGKKERGEADFLYSIFTQNYGLIRALAQGVRKPGAKLKGHLETHSKADVFFVSGRHAYRLVGAVLERPHIVLFGSTARASAASFAASLIERAAFEAREDGIWRLLSDWYGFLEREDAPVDDGNCGAHSLAFAAKMLSLLGSRLSEDDRLPEKERGVIRVIERAPFGDGEAVACFSAGIFSRFDEAYRKNFGLDLFQGSRAAFGSGSR